MPVDEQIAESSTATETENYIATQHSEWLKNGTPFPKEKEPEPAKTEEAQPAEVATEEKPAEVIEETPEAKMKAETQARFDELLKDRAEWKERTAKLEKQIADLAAAKPAEPKAEEPKPKPEAAAAVKRMSMNEYIEKNPGKDFEDYQDYCAEYASDRAAERVRKEFESLESKRSERIQTEERDKVYTAGIEELAVTHPDVVDVLNLDKNPIPISPIMDRFLVTQGKSGIRILYELGKDIANTKRIAALDPIVQIEELVLIKRQLSDAKEPAKADTPKPPAPPPPKKPSAAAPIGTQLPGTTAAPEDEAKAALAANDFTLYKKIMNARDIARAKGN